MSVLCTKQLTIQVSGIRQPTNYWKLQSITGGVTTPPSVGANVLNVGSQFATEAGGIIGPTCLNMLGGGGVPASALVSTAGDYNFGAMATGWTLRFWIKCDQPNPGFEDITDLNILNRKIADGFDWQIFPNAGKWGAIFIESGTFNNVYAQDTFTIDSNWHRGILKFDTVGKNLSWKFDNQTTITTHDALGFFFNTPNTQLQFIGNGIAANRHLSICEIGLWQNILLTESEMLVDWNGGTGLTFP